MTKKLYIVIIIVIINLLLKENYLYLQMTRLAGLLLWHLRKLIIIQLEKPHEYTKRISSLERYSGILEFEFESRLGNWYTLIEVGGQLVHIYFEYE